MSVTAARLARVVALLALLAAVAVARYAALTDSVTVDEPSHLLAGYVAIERGDYRLSPDHPPLARMLLSWPLATSGAVFLPPGATSPEAAAAWRSGDFFRLGRELCETWNEGQRLVGRGRTLAIGLLALLLATIYRVARGIFGEAGATVALVAAAFDPTLLAHGHLATMDAPFSLAVLVALVAWNAWLRRPDGKRLAVATAAVAAVLLVKFSAFAVLPALPAMAIAARRAEPSRLPWRRLALAGTALAGGAFLAIWATYQFRFAAAVGPDAATATMHVLSDAGRPLPTTPAGAWESVLHDPATGADRPGLATPALRFLHSARILPEAYLYGLAYVAKKGSARAAYLRGDYSMRGFASYFGWAFAIKTPLATLALAALGTATLLAGAWGGRRKAAMAVGPAWPPLAWGLLTFAVAYLFLLTGSALNLGVRHLLPVLPLVWLAAGAAWPRETGSPLGRFRAGAVALLLLVLAAGTVAQAPRLIGYFNEAVGGWRQGHLYLADSNLDWGQDLLRLEERLRRAPPQGPVWLAQASDPPLPRGLGELGTRWLFGRDLHSPDPTPIAGGLYVISATELLGVYRPLARAASWRDPRLPARFEKAAEEHRLLPGATPPGELGAYEALRRLRLISRLAQREPDERVGTSLFLFDLSDGEVAEMTTP